ncbi:hypothetical protein A3F07_02825 [candidate division WWE3 bacterium RIFCSPHIGHO2_12_FULL_38_15]|uniref:O-antigen ligase-related domain-containing protein n=1 Tax=candidate division WWE3 bacterium RIFCSPHIGHO2_02_FULL_38_14 TaxID=1802620 RepID=A0A1F4VA24_UNCKA|nr:MAG: hypothetical protein A2793_04450 [candidate division WWE3 bacterium RIFCSPHIGHO2_01_FULL_38_45]OGC49345.1 MAG: hypothetical protein A3F07_02825 [candidate division WWE3 bacterium RIFCSPHIGHO2_12_FULL_38_15]OGC53948.1 MAG: hypothetical protein A3B64_02930 [candidate division WWE3 bacterium RIFCSPLOWO2_01_FULL_37_24]OGC54024.1 MAG: hypothetical protein A3D91_04665 [candidate division WWE3 bacterium RIFCSPHIGHO2_02_FULL_38_14]
MLKSLFVISFFILALGQLSSVSKSEGINLYLFDVFILIYALLGIVYLLINRQLIIPKTLVMFFIFCFIGLTTLVANKYKLETFEFLTSISYLIRLFIYLLFATTTFNLLTKNIIKTDIIIKTIILSGVIICILGFIQLIILPDFEVLDPDFGWDPHKYRLASTFFDPNFTGAYINLCFILLLYYKLDLKGRISKKLFYILLILFLISLLLTFSRSAWLMFSLIVLIYGILKSPKLIIMAGLMAFLAYFAVPRIQTRISGSTDPADSAYYRFISWSNAVEISKDNPVIGVGFNAYRYAQLEYGFVSPDTLGGHSGAGSDSSLLLVLATTGIIGFVIFLMGLMHPLILFFKSKEFIFYTLSFLGLMVHSLFVNSLFFPQIAVLWILFLALAEYFNFSSRT